MDYLKYVESKTLRDYWEKIGYNPDPMALVYLITYNSDAGISKDESQADLFSLAKEYGNLSLKKYKQFVNFDTFNDFINGLIDLQNKMGSMFFSSKNLGSYSAKIYKKNSDIPFELKNVKLTDIYKHADMMDVDYIVAENVIPAGKHKEEDYFIRVKLNSNCDLVEILGGSGTADEDDILHGFMGIYHDFPHPFKIGDYVRCILPSAEETEYKNIYKVIGLPKTRAKNAKQDNIADNFMDMCMTLISEQGEKVYIHVHDIELVKAGLQE